MVRTCSFGRGTNTVLSQSSNALRESSRLILFETCTTEVARKSIITRQTSLLFDVLITHSMPNFEVYIATSVSVHSDSHSLSLEILMIGKRERPEKFRTRNGHGHGHLTDTTSDRYKDMSEYGTLQTTKFFVTDRISSTSAQPGNRVMSKEYCYLTSQD